MELSAAYRADGSVYLDYLTWDGAPDVVLTRPAAGGTMWRRAWVDGVDQYEARWPEPYRLVQNHGTGLLIQGTRAWTDYRASAGLTLHLAAAAGLGARVQGMRRYYALLLCDDGTARLIKALDGDTVLAQAAFPWTVERTYALSLQVVGIHIQAWIDDRLLFDVQDTDRPFSGGGVALICREGCMSSDAVTVHPSRDPGESVGAVVAGVHRGHHRQQHLSGADVTGRLVATDVLLARLQCQPVSG